MQLLYYTDSKISVPLGLYVLLNRSSYPDQGESVDDDAPMDHDGSVPDDQDSDNFSLVLPSGM